MSLVEAFDFFFWWTIIMLAIFLAVIGYLEYKIGKLEHRIIVLETQQRQRKN